MTASATRRTERRFVSNRDESCRMFQSNVLERLSHVHPAVPHVLYVPLISWMVWAAYQAGVDVASVIGWFFLGVLFWTFTEYVIHRFVFHPPQWVEDDTRRVVGGLKPTDPVMPALPSFRHKFYFLVHGVHHDYPNDSSRLVMPPSVSIPLALLFYVLFMKTLGAGAGQAAFAGFVAGYLAYDTTHFFTHHGASRTAFAKYQKKRHFRHHYYDSTHDYGVSSPLWDAAWGTLGAQSEAVSRQGERPA